MARKAKKPPFRCGIKECAERYRCRMGSGWSRPKGRQYRNYDGSSRTWYDPGLDYTSCPINHPDPYFRVGSHGFCVKTSCEKKPESCPIFSDKIKCESFQKKRQDLRHMAPIGKKKAERQFGRFRKRGQSNKKQSYLKPSYQIKTEVGLCVNPYPCKVAHTDCPLFHGADCMHFQAANDINQQWIRVYRDEHM